MLRHFRVPTFVPVLAIASCLVLLGQQNWETWMRAGVLIIVGMLLLWVIRRSKYSLPVNI